jgi:hypothetical protein
MTTLHALPRIAPEQDTLDSLLIASLPPHVAERITVHPVSGCWLWDGPTDRDGYGKLRGRGVHRIVYEILIGPVPPGLVLDHREDWGCLSRRCCCVFHLNPCTSVENVMRGQSFAAVNARKTRCDHGHRYDVANTYRRPDGHRDCRACIRRRVAEYKTRQRVEFARAA